MGLSWKTRFTGIVRTIVASAACCIAMAAASFALEGTVDTAILNVRTGTSVQSELAGRVYQDQKLEITGRLGDWYSIDYNGERAFVFSDYIRFDNYYNLDMAWGMVSASSEKSAINVREEPTTDSAIVTRLLYGTNVRVLGYTDGWYSIRYSGIFGYISADYLELDELVYTITDAETASGISADIIEDESPVNQKIVSDEKPVIAQEPVTVEEELSLRQQIVDYAMTFLGTRYVYGGASPSTGFDCSGFTQYVYKNFGYFINRSSSAQISNGVKVTRDQLQPGDLVFFSRPGYSVGHVGIYIGNGQFIHAPCSGDVVKISSLSESYYAARYVGARRIVSD